MSIEKNLIGAALALSLTSCATAETRLPPKSPIVITVDTSKGTAMHLGYAYKEATGSDALLGDQAQRQIEQQVSKELPALVKRRGNQSLVYHFTAPQNIKCTVDLNVYVTDPGSDYDNAVLVGTTSAPQAVCS